MKSKLDSDTTPEQKLSRFYSALGSVVRVSKDDLQQRIVTEEKQRRLRKNKPGPKPSASS